MKKILLSVTLLASVSLYSMMQPINMGRVTELEALAAFRKVEAIAAVLGRRYVMSEKDLRVTVLQYQKQAGTFPGLAAEFMSAARVLNGELMRRYDSAQAELARQEEVRMQRQAYYAAAYAAARKEAEKKGTEAAQWETIDL